jgi:hypothetical protein
MTSICFLPYEQNVVFIYLSFLVGLSHHMLNFIVGFCILLRVCSLMLFLKTTVRNSDFCARFYCALLNFVILVLAGNTYGL